LTLFFGKSYLKNILNVQINTVYHKRNNKSKRKTLYNYFTVEESPLVTIILIPDGPIPFIHQCKSSCIISTNKFTQIYYNKASSISVYYPVGNYDHYHDQCQNISDIVPSKISLLIFLTFDCPNNN